MYRPNLLKQRLAGGKPALGCWLHLVSPIAAELLALAGYDFLLIDNEHGPASLTESLGLLQAISATPTTAIMRVPWNDPVYLKRALDIGVEGVMIPAIETAEQASQAVHACRYPPLGFRGSAYQIVRGASFGIGTGDYMASAAENLLIICQIEAARAVENIDAIAAVDGIDVLFIGPNDLSGTIGRFGELNHPEVQALIERAERGIKAGGKKLGGIAYGGRSTEDMFERGYDILVGSSDTNLLRDGALKEVRAYRERRG